MKQIFKLTGVKTGVKIVNIAVYGNQLIIATDTKVFSQPLVERKERKKLSRPKGNDGTQSKPGLKPEDNGIRAGKEWPKGYVPPPKPKEKKK